MNRLLTTCFLTLAFLFATTETALAQERIPLFESVVRVNADAELVVVERIEYDFGENERRGIYRDLPLRFTLAGERRTVRITDVSVRSPSEDALPFTLTEEGSRLRIRIGDPEVYVTGRQVYVLSYTVRGAIIFLSEFDEVYWNVVGTEWAVPIDVVRAQIILGFPGAEILQASCYAGKRGETSSCGADSIHDDRLRYEALHENLSRGSGMTMAVGFPKGLLAEPASIYTPLEQVLRVIGIPFALLLALWSWYRWYTRGRDPARRQVLVRHFSPPEGLSPAEAGVVVDGIAHTKDIVAQLIELARAGFFTIHQFETKGLFSTTTDYLLEQHHKPDNLLYAYDRDLLSALFVSAHMSTESINGRAIEGVKLSALAHKLSPTFSSVSADLYATVAERGFYERDPKQVRTRWGIAAGVLLFGTGALIAFYPPLQTLTNVLASIVGAGVVALTGRYMPVRTKEGVAIKEHLLGLREYLSVAEKDRLAFHNSPERTPEEFDALLPYAIVLGVEKQWAAQFEGVFTEPPAWFAPAQGHAFTVSMFVADVQGFSASMRAAGASASSGASGGGGSVGGGAGGGGGGSW